MLKKIKSILGIEGVKLNIHKESYSLGHFRGKVLLQAPSVHFIQSLHYKLEEHYTRGRFKSKKRDVYLLEEGVIPVGQRVGPQSPLSLPFELDFKPLDSPLDVFGKSGWLQGAVAHMAKKANATKSTYMLTIQARVEGNKLRPFEVLVLEE